MKKTFFLLAILTCVLSKEAKGAAVNHPGVWFKTKGATKAVALIAPGLNFKTENMNSLATTLQNEGIEVYRISLTGLNGNDMDDLIKVKPEDWRSDFKAGYDEVSKRALSLKVPIYFVGFSLGALVGLNEMTRNDSYVKFDRMALFAPALSLRAMTKLLNILKVFGNGFCIPSKNLPEYRVYSCTPMGAYTALLSGIKEFESQRSLTENVPTIIFIDPRDELVSLMGLKKMIQDRGLSQWSFFQVDENQTLLPRRIHHLIIDEMGVGPLQWVKITGFLKSHFGVDSAPLQ